MTRIYQAIYPHSVPRNYYACLLLVCVFCIQKSLAQVSMNATGTYVQDFNTLISAGTGTWTDNSTIANWYAQRTGVGISIEAGIGSNNAGNLYSYGSVSSTDRALGTIGSGNANIGDFAHGLLLRNTSSRTISQFTVSYTLEQWRNSAAAAQSINFYYKKTSVAPLASLFSAQDKPWVAVPSLNASSPITGGGASALDGNAAVNRIAVANVAIPNLLLEPGEYIYLKWEDLNHTGDDHGLAIDDVSISWVVPTSDISISSITQSSFTLSDCTTPATASINFSNTGIVNAGNIYTVQLSDGNGSFTSPSTVATLNSASTTVNGLSINIPAAIISGNNYRLRVIASNNSLVGTNYGTALTINQPGYCATSSTDYFRSVTSGSWSSASSWESSPNASFSPVITATSAPSNAANTITIRNGHTINIDAYSTGDQITINNGGILIFSANTFVLSDGTGDDLNIENGGVFTLAQANTPPSYGTGSPTVNVSSGGILRITTSGLTGNGTGVNSSNFNYQHQSILEWASSATAFSSNNVTYFPNVNATTVPIFRVSETPGFSVGAGGATTFNGYFEVAATKNVNWNGTGVITFRNGFGGRGGITLVTGSIQVTGTDLNNTKIEGPGVLTIAAGSGGVFINNLAQVSLNTFYNVNGLGTFTVNSGGWLNCGTNYLQGNSNFVLASGGRLGIGSPDGITASSLAGNIRLTTSRTFNQGGLYLYNGNTNQSTGDGLPSTVTGSIIIANTGTAGNNTVTLTTNNTTTARLDLNNGLFASGLNQNLNISNGGFIYGNGGNNPNSPNAGTITFSGFGSTDATAARNPYLYSVILKNGADFNGSVNVHSATIMNSLRLDPGSYVVDAPYYDGGSNLIYNTGGIYTRNVEWGSSANQGYPHHVTVQGDTYLLLYNGDPLTLSAVSQLTTAGNLTIGNANTYGKVYMSYGVNNMPKPLYIKGNLNILEVNAVQPVKSELVLSGVTGGDLWLEGNFYREANSYYTDNNRATFLKGTSSTSIFGATAQGFNYLYIDKTPDQTITLNSPVTISQLMTFTRGIVISSALNPLVIQDGASVADASFNSFVQGPVQKTGITPFTFPTGIKSGTTQWHYRPLTISNLSQSNTFTATFQRSINPYTLGGISPAAQAAGLSNVSRCEYWDLTRTAASGTATVTLSWSTNPLGTSQCNVSPYVLPGNESALRVVPFNNITSSAWGDNFGNNGFVVPSAANQFIGTVSWNVPLLASNSQPTNYERFIIGSTDWRLNPLPFRITRFKAAGKTREVQLEWNVQNDEDIQSYSIERSIDGIHFLQIGTVSSKRNYNGSVYELLDKQPENGMNYYRIKAIDQQGKSSYSVVQKIILGNGISIEIGPVPAANNLNIRLAHPEKILQIDLIGVNGELVQRISTIESNLQLNLSSLPAGTYRLRLIGKDIIETRSFIKE